MSILVYFVFLQEHLPTWRTEGFAILLKCYENHIFSIEAILRHKEVACIRRKMLFAIFKYLFLFQRYSGFKNMQISLVMTSYTQPSFDQM